MIRVKRPEYLVKHVSICVEAPKDVLVNDSMIDRYTDISKDWQWIHSIEAKPRIVPGNLLLALIPQLLGQCILVECFSRCLTVKYDNIRFKKSAVAGDTLGLKATINEVRTRFGNTFVTVAVMLLDRTTGAELLHATLTDCYEAEELGM